MGGIEGEEGRSGRVWGEKGLTGRGWGEDGGYGGVCVCATPLQHGIFRFARVCIIGNSCALWHCTALGAILAGSVMGLASTSDCEFGVCCMLCVIVEG